MVRHNFHTVNHREVIIQFTWLIPYTTEVNILKVIVIYHTKNDNKSDFTYLSYCGHEYKYPE